MTDLDELKAQTELILARIFPAVEIRTIEADETLDSGGDESLRITIVVRQRPPRAEAQKMSNVVDQLRSWLAAKGDDRFPYVKLLSEAEERRLQHAGE